MTRSALPTTSAGAELAALTRDDGPDTERAMLAAPQKAHWASHRAFIDYQDACEQRRQLAVQVGEVSQQMIDALCYVRLERAGGPAGRAMSTSSPEQLPERRGSRQPLGCRA